MRRINSMRHLPYTETAALCKAQPALPRPSGAHLNSADEARNPQRKEGRHLHVVLEHQHRKTRRCL